MKINKLTLAVAAFAMAALLASCGKREKNVAPEPDTEVQSAVDAAWATYLITDLDMICSYVGEGEEENMPYAHIESSAPTNTMDAVRDVSEKRLSAVFTRVRSQDGRFRHGEVRLIYNPDHALNDFSNPNAVYYHEFGYGGLLALSDYRVDSFHITVMKPGFAYIINKLPDDSVDTSTEKIKWEITGKFNIRHPHDESGAKDIHWDGKLIKVLENTNDTAVFNPDRIKNVINWDKARISYYGEIKGIFGGTRVALDQPNSGGTPFTISIKESQKLIRDFTCSPDRARGVEFDATNNLTPLVERHHPFVEGVMTFTNDDKYPRQIYFGNESNSNLAWQCDNTGEVMIKGIAYRVNFRK